MKTMSTNKIKCSILIVSDFELQDSCFRTRLVRSFVMSRSFSGASGNVIISLQSQSIGKRQQSSYRSSSWAPSCLTCYSSEQQRTVFTSCLQKSRVRCVFQFAVTCFFVHLHLRELYKLKLS